MQYFFKVLKTNFEIQYFQYRVGILPWLITYCFYLTLFNHLEIVDFWTILSLQLFQYLIWNTVKHKIPGDENVFVASHSTVQVTYHRSFPWQFSQWSQLGSSDQFRFRSELQWHQRCSWQMPELTVVYRDSSEPVWCQVGTFDRCRRSAGHRYRFPPQ